MGNMLNATQHLQAARNIMRDAEGMDLETRRLLAALAGIRVSAARSIREAR